MVRSRFPRSPRARPFGCGEPHRPPGARPRAGRLVVSLAILLAGSMAVPPAAADQAGQWRYFHTADGLRESYAGPISVGPSGRVWISHGTVSTFTTFDGYRFTQFPAPGPYQKVRESGSGTLWSVDRDSLAGPIGGVRWFAGERWHRFPIPGFSAAGNGETDDVFAPIDDHRVLLLEAARLAVYDVRTDVFAPVRVAADTGLGSFVELISAPKDGFWIAGEEGVARARFDGGTLQWEEIRLDRQHRLHHVSALSQALGGDLFATARDERTQSDVLLRLRGGTWTILARAASPAERLRGWSGVDGTFWIARIRTDSFTLANVTAAGEQPAPRSKVLSGRLLGVEPAGDGAFWIATNLGLARYGAGQWRAPRGVPPAGGLVNAIYEDRKGRLFFTRPRSLLVLDGERWSEWSFPAGHETRNVHTQGIWELPDGRIALSTRAPGVLLFNPQSGSFELVPDSRDPPPIPIAPRKAGGMWISRQRSNTFALEVFDGASFRPAHDLGQGWGLEALRHIGETGSGDLWVGGFGGNTLGRLRGNEYRSFASADGNIADGAFFILDVGGGAVWIGDRDGVVEFRDGRFTRVRSGFEPVRSMLRARDGSIWVGSSGGVHRFFDGTWVTHTRADGLPDAGVYKVFQDSRGRLWAGTTLGLSLHDPEADRDPPDTYVSDRDNLREAAPGGEVKFVFSGLDRWHYTDAARLLFSYRVDGGAWSPASADTIVSASALRAGPHRFEVRAMDQNANVDPTPAAFEFAVLLPWYRAPGFLATAGIATLIIVVLGALHVSRYQQLGRLVASRTRELEEANRQLQEDLRRREWEEAERRKLEDGLRQTSKLEAIGGLAGGVAHDFNNLLTVILGNVGLVAASLGRDHPARAELSEIEKAGTRAAVLTRQLLTFSRRQAIQPRLLAINDVVRDTETMIRRLVREDIELVLRLAPDAGLVLVDQGQLEQVIVNLIVNARDAMPRGGRLTVATSTCEVREGEVDAGRPGPHVVLSVSDTGIGIDETTRERLFEPFFTTKEPGEGTGLGLATVYGIVTQAGGHVRVQSTLGAGSTFSIYLPQATGEPQAVQPESAGANLAAARPHVRILLAEDDRALRRLGVSVLRKQGYEVLEAADGLEALTRWEEADGQIDLVIADVIMPRLGGRELARQLRERGVGAKVLFASGYLDDDVPQDWLRDPTINFIEKPFTASALLAKVRDLLQVHQ